MMKLNKKCDAHADAVCSKSKEAVFEKEAVRSPGTMLNRFAGMWEILRSKQRVDPSSN